MNKLFNFFKLIYKHRVFILLFILGLLLFSWIIYNRLFRHRDSTDINFELNYWKVLLYSYLCLLNLILLILLLIELCYKFGILQKKESYKETWYLSLGLIGLKFLRLFKESLETFYNNSFRQPLKNFWDRCCYFINDYQGVFVYDLPVFIFLCQYIVVLSLVIDIFYFNHFHYFYKMLILLFIPFIINVWMYCIEEYAKEGIEYFKQLVEIKVIDEYFCHYNYVWISQKYVYDEEYMKELAEAHYGLSIVLRTFRFTKYYKGVYYKSLILHGIKCILYLICWGYLIFGMFFFH